MGSAVRINQVLQPDYNPDGFPGNSSGDISGEIAADVITDPDAQALLDAQITAIVLAELPFSALVSPELVQEIIDNTLQTTPSGNFGQPFEPSTPVVSGIPNGLLVVWDGLNIDGTMTRFPDFSHVDVHMSLSNGFVPDSSTRAASIQATPGQGGQAVVPSTHYGVPNYVRFVAVSLNGLSSDPSPQATGMPLQIEAIDVGQFALTVLNFIDDKHHLY